MTTILRNSFPENERLVKLNDRICNQIIDNYKSNNAPINQVLKVDKRTGLSEKNFIKEYFSRNKPVIFEKEASNWPAIQKWSLNYIEKNFAEDNFRVFDSKGLVENEYSSAEDSIEAKHIRTLTGKEFVKGIKSGKNYYVRGCPIIEDHPELKEDLDLSWLQKMRRCFLGVSYQSFIGAANRRTPLHNESTSFFFIVVEGRKRWNLFESKDYALLRPIPSKKGYNYSNLELHKKNHKTQNHPGVEFLKRYTCELNEGDILFVPAWMWHDVETLDEGWSVSYRYTSLRSFFSCPLFVIIRVFFAKPSFFKTLYYSYFRKDMSKRSENILVPRLILHEGKKDFKSNDQK